MLFPNINPRLKGIKIESTEDAIKRGLEVIPVYDDLSRVKSKHKNASSYEVKTELGIDTYTADDFKQMNLLFGK